MAYDEATAERIRNVFKGRRNVAEKKMFGGIAFMFNGHMCCGLVKDKLVLRLGEEGAAKALKRKHARPMDFTGKPMKTMVYVDPAGYRNDGDLKAWVKLAAEYAATLKPKK
ncbi:MAG: TfoX/Sxy family protein [Planctomycetes bacterium]|nr:TfoX/Sxy family protein [Planctomycetota bacterium]NUQ34362.1 TfoX/Sxy family protein [Planctomycetaceae bacterium]